MRKVAGTALVLAAAATLTAVGSTASAVAPAVSSGAWVGKATNMAGDFNYGAVKFTVRGDTVRGFIIEGVTTDCGYMSLVMNPMKIKGNTISSFYQPVKDVDQAIVVDAKFKGKAMSGTFTAGPLCGAEGKFSAQPK